MNELHKKLEIILIDLLEDYGLFHEGEIIKTKSAILKAFKESLPKKKKIEVQEDFEEIGAGLVCNFHTEWNACLDEIMKGLGE